MIQLLPGIRIKVPNKHSTYGRGKVKTIQLISGKHILSKGYMVTTVTVTIWVPASVCEAQMSVSMTTASMTAFHTFATRNYKSL